ncbi:hypothetical protein [Nitratireductor sp. ZSWI3]|uniref:hypothetical protein n=1 Tax=Nitratireductor sp. ZSWI3 TaxID=2966359 RepID=UPI00215037AC|nr:hypothetical protein [Nitratireductor sp. ZSWI3]MCR4264857.1 hypothetical protein [Nitratireductor sp. ZSWI3]
MTKIDSLTGDAAETRSLAAGGRSGFPSVLVAAAFAITVINVMAAVYLYKAKSELTALDGRLEDLASFEKRLQARLDGVNNGLQSQFDLLNRNLQGQFYDLATRIDRQERSLQAFAERRLDGIGYASRPPDEPVTDPASAPAKVAENLPAATSAAKAGARPARTAPPKPSASYQRLESPDGKVYYKKMR